MSLPQDVGIVGNKIDEYLLYSLKMIPNHNYTIKKVNMNEAI